MSAILMSSGYAQQNVYSANGVQVKNETTLPETACQKAGKLSNKNCCYVSERGLSFGAVSLSASFRS